MPEPIFELMLRIGVEPKPLDTSLFQEAMDKGSDLPEPARTRIGLAMRFFRFSINPSNPPADRLIDAYIGLQNLLDASPDNPNLRIIDYASQLLRVLLAERLGVAL